jgi:nitroimidazol reductase NimA-like FMN-containing flavoprotein (pyridoxamine 5'-phosphate oxidase superfamily)
MTAAQPGTRISRLPGKQSDELAALHALLDEARIGHFGLVRADGTPAVIPTAIARDGSRVIAHGSTGSPWMRQLAAGSPTALAVTALDALVVARSGFESSMRYRSAVLFGRCAVLEREEKDDALELIVEHLLPGRSDEIRAPSRRELAATLVLALPIDAWSLKISAGWPEDELEDVEGDAWAGVLPIIAGYGQPLPAPDLRDGIKAPDSVRRLSQLAAEAE